MKKTVLNIGILILVLVSAMGCGDGKSSPEDVVRDFLNAVQVKDTEKMANLCTEFYADTWDLENFKEKNEERFTIYSNISTEIVEQSEDSAKVEVSGDYYFTDEGEKYLNPFTSTMFLIKVDDSWLIFGELS